MNILLPALASSAILVSAVPALADSVTSKVIAHDRVAHRVILADKTVFTYDPAVVSMPETVSTGDEVTVEYQSAGDDGIVKIDSITIVAEGDDS